MMKIVNQDKDAMINFDNVEILGIGNPLENNNGKFAIIANLISDNQYILAEYKTEERAKEVFQEIIEANRTTIYELDGNDYVRGNNTYEMPEE